MQKEVTNSMSVFRSDGKSKGGWSKKPILRFNINNYPSKKKVDHRHCFFAENEDCSFYIALEKTGIEFIVKVILLDKNNLTTTCDSIFKKFVLRKKKMPNMLSDKIFFENDRVKIALSTQGNNKHLRCQFNDFAEGDNLYFDFTFTKTKGDHLNLLFLLKTTRISTTKLLRLITKSAVKPILAKALMFSTKITATATAQVMYFLTDKYTNALLLTAT